MDAPSITALELDATQERGSLPGEHGSDDDVDLARMRATGVHPHAAHI